jgi:ParB-like chromosome segregation protein Spo0J
MHEIEYRSLDKIASADFNPKTHDLDAIERSFVEFGFVAPAVVDDATGKLVAGHGRVEALRRLQGRGEPAPKGIFVEGKVWKVPIVVGVNLTPEQARAYIVADNRISEIGGWDYSALSSVLGSVEASTIPLGAVGFSADDLRSINAELEVRDLQKQNGAGAGAPDASFDGAALPEGKPGADSTNAVTNVLAELQVPPELAAAFIPELRTLVARFPGVVLNVA